MADSTAGPRKLRQLMDAILTIGTDLDLRAILERIVRAATDLVDARYGALGVLDETKTYLADFVTVGIDSATYEEIGDLPHGHGILGVLIVDAKPLRLGELSEHPDSYGFPARHPRMHSFLGVPILVRDQVFGNLYLTDKTNGKAFTDVDEELVVGLAAAAGVAIENARLHDRIQQMAVLEDRERIARDLHDTVIQRLFATGLSLQGAARLAGTDPDATAARLDAAVEDLDTTVKHIRSAIFALESSRPTADGLRSGVLGLLRESAGALGFEPRVMFDGPIDSRVPPNVRGDVLAVVREALSNVARHAKASRVDVELSVDGDIRVRVLDDGVGLPALDSRRGNGLRNLGSRAEQAGGRFEIRARDTGGTELEWSVPIGGQ